MSNRTQILTAVRHENGKVYLPGQEDELAAAGLTPTQIKSLAEKGVLAGDWKSGGARNNSSESEGNDGLLPKDFPLAKVFENLGFKSVEEIQSKSEAELVALEGIGEATAKKALAYGK